VSVLAAYSFGNGDGVIGAVVHAVTVLILAPLAVITVGAVAIAYTVAIRDDVRELRGDSRHDGIG
jgi:hypothetical protein